AWGPHPAGTSYGLALAEHLARRGETYEPFRSPAHREDLGAALRLCNNIVEKFPATPAGQSAAALRVQLLRKNLSLKGEAVNPPGVPFRQLVEFQNVNRVYFSLYRLSSAELDALPTEGEPAQVLPYVASRKAFRQWRADLPGTADLQAHATEVKVDGLPLGQYLVVASGDSVARPADTAALAYARFAISNLAFVRRNGADRSQSFLVTDRQSGKPLAGVHLGFYRQRGPHKKLVQGQRTDALGRLTFPRIPEEPPPADTSGPAPVVHYDYFALHLGGDTLRFPETYVYWPDEVAPDSLRTLFFTDRALYRPGQTIAFKALLIRQEHAKRTAVPNRPVKIVLRGVNGQGVDSLQLITNARGACSGTFRAPAGLLNGRLTLADEFGYTQEIRVEAYKRPAFTARFEPFTGPYRVGDSVAVRGVARTYADAPVDGARVNYRITRFAEVPERHQPGTHPLPFDPVVELGNGTTTTDATGAFTVAFLAAGDSTLGRALQPTYAYQIAAEVTDANGETQSIAGRVNAGHTLLQMQVEMPAVVDGTRPVSVGVITGTPGTPGGRAVPTWGTLTVYRLQSPGRPLRSRPWRRPDVPVLTPDEYRQHFPNDAYGEEDQVAHWPRAEKALVLPFQSEKGLTMVNGEFSKLPAGEYVVEALARDSAGEEVRQETYFTLFQPRPGRYAKGEDHWLLVRQAEGQPGDEARFLLDPGGRAYVWLEVEKDGRIERAKWLRTGRKPLPVAIPILERHRGNFTVHFTFVRHGRAYTHTEVVRVPHSDKQLQVELLSFRDPLQPGQAEEWKLKLKGPNGKGVAAELAATLYDASLDALRPHDWEQAIFPYDGPDLEWSTETESFGTGYMGSDDGNGHWKSFAFEAAPPGDVHLNWFGYDHFGGYNAGYLAYQARVREVRLDRNTARVRDEMARGGRLLSGRVIDAADSTGLAGFLVSIADTRIFTQTDSAGRFSLRVPGRPVSLLVSLPDDSYAVAEAPVKAEAWLVIPLDLKAIDELHP
ncbi:MAG TPA: MG2 domain-containing protein, partial [Cytophagales bacterium]